MVLNRSFATIITLLVTLILSACIVADIPISPTDATQDEQFRETVMALEAAFQSGDVDQTIEFYAEDAVSMPPGFPASVGKEAIDADLRYFFGEYDLDRDFTLVDFEVTGETATRTGEWTQTLTPRGEGDPVVEVGRCIFGFKRVDNEWKIAWEIWNTYEPMN